MKNMKLVQNVFLSIKLVPCDSGANLNGLHISWIYVVIFIFNI